MKDFTKGFITGSLITAGISYAIYWYTERENQRKVREHMDCLKETIQNYTGMLNRKYVSEDEVPDLVVKDSEDEDEYVSEDTDITPYLTMAEERGEDTDMEFDIRVPDINTWYDVMTSDYNMSNRYDHMLRRLMDVPFHAAIVEDDFIVGKRKEDRAMYFGPEILDWCSVAEILIHYAEKANYDYDIPQAKMIGYMLDCMFSGLRFEDITEEDLSTVGVHMANHAISIFNCPLMDDIEKTGVVPTMDMEYAWYINTYVMKEDN